MKKSTLFFKVMVLLALLVPWTAWGQDVSTRSFGGSDDGKWKNPNLKRGEMTITLDASGNIVKVTNPAVVKNGTLELDLDDIRNLSDNWEFDTNKGWAIIDPSNELEKYFSIKVDDDELTIVKNRYGSAFTDVSEEFKIKVVNSGKHGTATGHILIKFKKETTDITNNTNISIDFSATGTEKTYDGTAVSVTVNDKDKEEPLKKDTDYTITISKDGKSVTEIKDAGIYTVEITGKGKYEGKKTANYTIKQKELTVTIKDQTIELPNGKVTTTLTTTGADATISASDIIPGETVEFNGAIATASTANASKPGKYENGLIENSSSKITSKNGNYTVKTVTPGDLIVKYNVTDDNYEGAFTVTTEGNGKYTYDNKEHGATVTSKTEGLTDCLEIWYKEVDGEPTQEKPKHVGEYTIVIKKKADAKCEYITIPEAGITTDKKIVISAKEITVTGSVTVEQGATLKDSYNADELNLQASETGIEGLTLEFTGSVEPNENAKTDEVSEGIENAFTVQEEGGWTIDITADETYFKTGDITIKDINIKLVVTEKEVQWYDGEAKAEVTVYVNENGNIKYGEDAEYGQSVRIALEKIKSIKDWAISSANQSSDKIEFDGDKAVQTAFSWDAVGSPTVNILMISGTATDLSLPASIKVKIEKDGEEGYLQINFEKDESTEEPGGDWDEGDAKASITVYVNAETGKVIKSEPAMESEGVIDLDKVNSELSGWAYATEDSKPIIKDEESISSVYTFVMDMDKNLVIGPAQSFDAEKLPGTVKVKIENDNEEGYLLVTFAKDESTEEPENPNEPDWAQGKANGTVTAYVNPEGSITRVEGDGTFTSGHLMIDPKGDWKFAIAEGTDDKPVFSDNLLSKSFTWGVAGNGNLNVYGLDYNESVYNILPKEVKLQIKNGEQTSYVLIKFVQDDDTWAKEEFAKATVTVYVDAAGNVVSTTPTLTVDGKNAINNNGALTISLEEVELAEWAYSAELLDGNLTSNPETSGDDISTSFSLMINGEGNLFVENVEPYVSQLPATVKVKIENEDNVGYLEIAFEKIIVIDPSDIAGGDDDDENGEIDENGNLLGTAEGEKTVYDSETHELAILKVNGLDEPLRVGEDYTVVYTAQESGDLEDDLPYHAGIYDVTITLGDKYITTTGAKEFATTVEITKRDLHLAFSIEENAKIEDLNEKLDLTEGLVICTPENLAQNDKLAGVITATFTIGQEPVDGLYPVYPETIHFENTENFNYTDYNISYDYTDLTGIEHQEEITPDEDGDVEIGDGEGEIPADDPIGGIEYVNPETGEGSAGGYYEKKYRLYLAVKDKNSYYVEDAEADYAAEGLELFSLHDKKTTWAGGSFTVWYEHNKVANEGGYRVFIKRGKHADYEEVKLDEVSGYYQIRNVQSDIYVRLYFGTGFPVANEEIAATDARAYAQANKIVVITPEPTDVQVISMAGAVVATDQVTGQREFANLAEGVYIVRMGETVIKLQVRN